MTLFGIDSLPSDLVRLLRSLPLVADRLDAIAASTSEVPTMRAAIDGRMAEIEASMPVLVEVQQHLSKLPETIESSGRASIVWRA